MVAFIFGLIGLAIAGVGVWLWRRGKKYNEGVAARREEWEKVEAARREENRYYSTNKTGPTEDKSMVWWGRGTVAFGLLLAALTLPFSVFFTQGVGEAKVIVNLDGTIAGEKLDPGFGVKAPWQDFSDWDLFSQEVLYAGDDVAPAYSGGQINGKEVTVAVGGLAGGSTQANVDISIVYSIDADQVTELYAKYKNQERFTKQVVEKSILTTVRQIPADYNATEFRGTKRQEAADKIIKSLNTKMNPLGVTIDFVNIQDIRYPKSVETALRDVEVANQNVQKAEADKRTAQVAAETAVVKAQGEADAAVATAKGTAEANALLNASLTPQILQQRYIDALKQGTIYVVPEGSTPFIGAK